MRKLRKGDEIFWNDPDGGKCSRCYTIADIKYSGDMVKITDVSGDYIECLLSEIKIIDFINACPPFNFTN